MSYADFSNKFKDGTFVFSAMPNDSEDHLLAVYSNNSSILKVLCHIIATDEGLAKMVVELGLKGELAALVNKARKERSEPLIDFDSSEDDEWDDECEDDEECEDGEKEEDDKETPCPECGDHHDGQELMSGFLELLGELESLKDVLEKKAKAEKRKSQ